MAVKLTDARIKKQIENNKVLSDSSKQSYITSMKRIIGIVKYNVSSLIDLKKEKDITIDIKDESNLYNVIINPKKFIVKFNNCIEMKSTLTNTVSVILTIIKLFNLQDIENEKFTLKWITFHKKLKEELDDVRMNGLQDENKVNIKWLDVLKKRQELEDSNSDYTLLLSIYSLIPPRRVKDYFRMKINPDNDYKEKELNYIEMKRKKGTIVIKDYKTSKQYGDYKITIPQDLFEVIKESIKQNPREYLFENSKDEAYEDDLQGLSSFTKRICRDLEIIFEKKVTVNTLRHSYITYHLSLYKNNMITMKELKAGALAVGHNLEEHMRYEER
jgi:hypothetical protein